MVLPLAGDGNIRIWKDYTSRGQQKLVTAFSSIHGHRVGMRSVNAVVDWQQQSGCLVHPDSQIIENIEVYVVCVYKA